MLKSRIAAALITGFCFIAPSHASSVSYFLDQSNKLADGINYLKVTISDEGKPGDIDFTVEALQPLLELAGDKFGIRKFGFNVVGGVGAEASDVDARPDNWRARNGGRMDGFGLFDITLKAGFKPYYNYRDEENEGKPRWKHGPDVQDPLTFSIYGVDFDTILSYVDLSTGRAPEGFSLFSAEVTGINFGDCGNDKEKGSYGSKCRTGSAYFGGTSAVPAPPAVWLLGTGILGLVARRLRSAKAI